MFYHELIQDEEDEDAKLVACQDVTINFGHTIF